MDVELGGGVVPQHVAEKLRQKLRLEALGNAESDLADDPLGLQTPHHSVLQIDERTDVG